MNINTNKTSTVKLVYSDHLRPLKSGRCSKVSISSTFFARFFHTNVVFLCTHKVHVTRKKAAETTFVRIMRLINIHEIDTKGGRYSEG